MLCRRFAHELIGSRREGTAGAEVDTFVDRHMSQVTHLFLPGVAEGQSVGEEQFEMESILREARYIVLEEEC